MFSQNQEEVKLEWMYKGAHSSVDREEYLLGRSVDKALEKLNDEEKQQHSSNVQQPKNHVEHECIPPSIRDYKEQVGEQVDLAAKLQEDPLIAIKKREEENRRQFLNNPIQIKKLQKALKSQEKQKKKNKKSKYGSDSEEDIDKKLAKKLKFLKSSSGVEKGKVSKKNKSENNLDTILMHKYNELKGKLTQDDLTNILDGKLTDTSSDESVSKDSDSDDDGKMKKKFKRYKNENKKVFPDRNKRWNSEKEVYIKEQRRNSSGDRYRSERNNYRTNFRNNDNRSNERRYKNKRGRSKSSSSEREQQYKKSTKGKEDPKHTNSKISNDNRKNNSDNNSSESEQKRKSKQTRDMSSSSDSSDDSYSRKQKSKKSWGLIRPDGTKIPLSKKNSSATTSTKHEQPNKVQEVKVSNIRKSKPLTEEEREKKRREMMENAAWRDLERTKNVKHYREKEKEEAKSQKDYDPEFLHKQLIKSTKTGSVESRIKANINNIQRSGSDMNRHFSRR